MKEVDAIIDKKLPGHPRFQHHTVMVGSEVCDVFYRNVIECIRSLFGDPNFAPYLCFAPEKNYTDDTKETRMYHDMHTGKWWWATQVSFLFLTRFLMPGIEDECHHRKPSKRIAQARLLCPFYSPLTKLSSPRSGTNVHIHFI